jgi:hypothetical protein
VRIRRTLLFLRHPIRLLRQRRLLRRLQAAADDVMRMAYREDSP